ncbi:hypothetical protein EAO70_04870 [Streptomyces sp. adm13(2018)]|uniref:hypothetical protein n=1 Tax=Streptomyces sp. adm13(2018) TaxID=2479007 RepID=UPI0011CD8D5C|nr:hypothetical protein [Streptomyces sp. adm13(2018)]TXS23107.1 hypothetical protein EAO70_04870 [Streptomyces sp. adm13(2018)]
MTFDYRDTDGDTFVVSNSKTDAGQPVVWMATSPDGVNIDPADVEEVIAGIRDAARQASGQQPDTDAPVARSASGVDTQPAVEAHPPRVQWVIEWYREAKGEWLEDQPAYNHHEDAVDEIARARRHEPRPTAPPRAGDDHMDRRGGRDPMTQPTAPATEAELWMALHDAMDGNLSMSRRRKLIDSYKAAVLRGAADAQEAGMDQFFTEWPDEPRNSPYANGRKDAITELRRMADEETNR